MVDEQGPLHCTEEEISLLTYHPTTEAEMAVISGWRYEGPYAIYDLKPPDEQRRLGRGFANPRNHYYSFADGARLVGFINLIGNEAAVFLGVGVRPDLCGQGYGTQICRQALALARQLHPGKPVALEVRSWNRRAIRCYEKAGFRIVGEPVRKVTPIGEGEFYRMEAEGAP